MSVKKFKFVSPGIFLREIDNSQLPKLPEAMGPLVIGRTVKGPGMRPVKIDSFSEFVDVFGMPVPGSKVGDVWRDGNQMGPTYAAYAAQAYLASSSPVTVMRLLGDQHSKASATGEAGWETDQTPSSGMTGGGAYGLFVVNGNSSTTAAQCKITFSNAPTAEETITIIDAAGTSKEYTAKASETLASREFSRGGANSAVAQSLLDCIAHAQGHNGTITGVRTDATLVLTQATAGAAGNTAVTENLSAVTVAGGSDGSGATNKFTGGGMLTNQTGSLAAVWYLNQGSMALSGTTPGDSASTPLTGTSVLCNSVGDQEFKVLVYGTDGGATLAPNAKAQDEVSFNFDVDSDKYIRRAFNTNPTLTNNTVTEAEFRKNYWLGETFERDAFEAMQGSTGAGNQHAFIACLAKKTATTTHYGNQRKSFVPSETGWILSQDTRGAGTYSDFAPDAATTVKKLFKFVSIDGGSEWNHSNLKISIQDIRPPVIEGQWASFTVAIRKMDDNDKNVKIIEMYSRCNLNPNSPNYVARKVGDKYILWDSDERRLVGYGDYDNNSSYIRVVMASDGAGSEHYPYGAYGPVRYKSFTVSGSANTIEDNGTGENGTFLTTGTGKITRAHASSPANGVFVSNVADAYTAQFDFPKVPLRLSGTDGGLTNAKQAYFGADTSRSGSSVNRHCEAVSDILRVKPEQTATSFDLTSNSYVENSWVFTLDDVVYSDSADDYFYESGSRAGGRSVSAASGSSYLLTGSEVNKFTTLLYGGFDGLDVREKEPFRNSKLSASPSDTENYAYHTLKRAVDTVADPEYVEFNLAAIPGVSEPTLTKHLVEVCEERADALAVIDLESDYVPETENTDTRTTRLGNLNSAVNLMKNRKLDSSYGCAYYPWVQVRDDADGSLLWVPPSVIALGTMAYSEANSEVWFAPAGFQRGGLTNTKAGGLTVTGVRQHLTSKQRDKLYEQAINPIATFPSEGIVVFGQKTLQMTPSALDRINVRRLLLFIKKEVSRISASTLFGQNVKTTWNGFSGKVERMLGSVQSRLGLEEFLVVLDESTTTPDLVDRNIMYAKILLKPAKAIEYIAIDFVITNQGAAFED